MPHVHLVLQGQILDISHSNNQDALTDCKCQAWDFVHTSHLIHVINVWVFEGPVLRSRLGSRCDLIKIWHFAQTMDSIHLFY